MNNISSRNLRYLNERSGENHGTSSLFNTHSYIGPMTHYESYLHQLTAHSFAAELLKFDLSILDTAYLNIKDYLPSILTPFFSIQSNRYYDFFNSNIQTYIQAEKNSYIKVKRLEDMINLTGDDAMMANNTYIIHEMRKTHNAPAEIYKGIKAEIGDKKFCQISLAPYDLNTAANAVLRAAKSKGIIHVPIISFQRLFDTNDFIWREIFKQSVVEYLKL